MRLKAIIFDVDGTLAETEEVHRCAFNQAFAEAGLSWHWSETNYSDLLTTTGGRERIARYMAEIGLPADRPIIADLHRRKNEIYADVLAAGKVVPRPGVERLIRESLDRGITLAIATTTSRANLDALLRNLPGLSAERYFSVIVAGEDVAAKKPDPQVYQEVLAKLELLPTDCVAIEDSEHGLAAARASGFATVITPSRYTRWHNFTGAALVCANLNATHPPVNIEGLEALVTCHTGHIDIN